MRGHFEVFSIGADAILLEEYETLSGLSFSFGIGAGIDWVHGYTTTNIFFEPLKQSLKFLII